MKEKCKACGKEIKTKTPGENYELCFDCYFDYKITTEGFYV